MEDEELLSFANWAENWETMRKFSSRDGEVQWNELLKNQEKFIQRKMLERMPATLEEMIQVIESCFPGAFLPFNSGIGSFWRRLNYVIISFGGFEEKLLRLVWENIQKRFSTVGCCFVLLSRPEMLEYYKQGKQEVLTDIIKKLLDKRDDFCFGDNACLPKFFELAAPALRENCPELFDLISNQICLLIKIWSQNGYAHFRSCLGYPMLVEDQWGFFDEAYQQRLAAVYNAKN